MAADRTAPPDDLHPPGKKLWTATQRWLVEHGVWQSCDGEALARYVRAVERGRRGREQLGDELTSLGSQGQEVQHPTLRTIREADRDAADFAKALLLTPDARKRHEIHARPPRDALEELLSAGEDGDGQ